MDMKIALAIIRTKLRRFNIFIPIQAGNKGTSLRQYTPEEEYQISIFYSVVCSWMRQQQYSFMQLSACGLCQVQVPTNNTSPADLPLYSPQTDSLKLTPRKLCKNCHTLLSQITEFAAHYQIKYCDSNFKSSAMQGLRAVIPQPKQALQLLYASQSNSSQRGRSNSDNKNKLVSKRFSQGQLPVGQNQQEEILHPYISLVVDEIKSKNVLCMSHLPKTLQLVIYLATQQSPKNAVVSPEERREKIKNVILFLAERIHLNLEELPYVVVLVNFLLCMMDPNKATAVVIRLSDIIMAYPHLLTWKTLILEQQFTQSKNPHSPASLDLRTVILKVEKLWLRIETFLQLSKKGEAVLHEGIIRISKLNIVQYKEYRKRLGEVLKAFLAKKEEKEDLKSERLSQLYLLKLQKNSFSMILKHIIESQEEMRQQMAQINLRHKKQKDEYVQKIIKLSNKIEELQIKIKELKNEKVNETVITEFREVEQVLYSPVLEEQLAVTQTHSILENQGEGMHVQLQTILTLTNLVGFNEQHLPSGSKAPAKIEENRELTQIIIEEINRLQDCYIKLIAKAKHAQQEKSRLLGIVTRKDDRFISVITQKDIIIERYEQALWRMQNGLTVEQQPLAHRIRYIMHIFAKRSREEQCDPDSESNDGREEKEKKEGKECDIY